MKHSLTRMILLAAGLTLGGCVDDYGGGYGGVYSAGSYPYGGYYDAYPGGYYRGDGYYRGYSRDRAYRAPVDRPAPRPNWNSGRPRGDEAGRGGWHERNNSWGRNPAGSGHGGRWQGRR